MEKIKKCYMETKLNGCVKQKNYQILSYGVWYMPDLIENAKDD